MPAGKRLAEYLRKALHRYGDVSLRQAFERASERKPGAPRQWDGDTLLTLYLEVEILRDEGLSIKAACRKIAKAARYGVSTLENRYVEARLRYERIVRPHRAEILRLHQAEMTRQRGAS